jgi:hypothetical protein
MDKETVKVAAVVVATVVAINIVHVGTSRLLRKLNNKISDKTTK